MERKYDTGYRFTTKDGEDCEVIGRKGEKVIVRFLKDGWETECFTNAIKKGVLKHMGHVVHPKIGDIFDSKNCGRFEVIQKTGKIKYIVRFINTGYEKEVYISNIRSGQIKDPHHPCIFGVGYLGGVIQDKRSYAKWRGMIGRCYDPKNQRYETYGAVGVTVCEKWHNYQNFHEWWLGNVGENPDWEIDKDLKSSGVKVYSPETCILIPPSLNSAMSNYTKPSIVKRCYGYQMRHGKLSVDFVKSDSLTYLIEKWGDLMYNRLMEISLQNNFNPDDLHIMISNYVKGRLVYVNNLSPEQLLSW